MQKPGSHFGLPGQTQILGELNAAPLQCGYSDADFGTVYPEEYGRATFVLLEPNPLAPFRAGVSCIGRARGRTRLEGFIADDFLFGRPQSNLRPF
jgi:hypothetical protein